MENGKRSTHPITDETTIGQMGLTKREYFAGLAMQGILANKSLMDSIISYSQNNNIPATEVVSNDSILHADELLKQLNNE